MIVFLLDSAKPVAYLRPMESTVVFAVSATDGGIRTYVDQTANGIVVRIFDQNGPLESHFLNAWQMDVAITFATAAATDEEV